MGNRTALPLDRRAKKKGEKKGIDDTHVLLIGTRGVLPDSIQAHVREAEAGLHRHSQRHCLRHRASERHLYDHFGTILDRLAQLKLVFTCETNAVLY